MRFTAAERRAKLARLVEIEGYESIEELAQSISSDAVSPAICMNEDCDFTLRDGARPGRRLLRGVPHQLDAVRTHPRRTHLTAPMSFTIVPRQIVCGLSFEISSLYKLRAYMEIRMKNGSKRKAWTSVQVRELKTMARKKTPAGRIAKKLKRSEGATRQKAFSIGLSLDSR